MGPLPTVVSDYVSSMKGFVIRSMLIQLWTDQPRVEQSSSFSSFIGAPSIYQGCARYLLSKPFTLCSRAEPTVNCSSKLFLTKMSPS